MATLSPFYTYVQELITANRAFTVELNSGDRFDATIGNAKFSTAGALSLQLGNKTLVLNESMIVYVDHGGAPMP